MIFYQKLGDETQENGRKFPSNNSNFNIIGKKESSVTNKKSNSTFENQKGKKRSQIDKS